MAVMAIEKCRRRWLVYVCSECVCDKDRERERERELVFIRVLKFFLYFLLFFLWFLTEQLIKYRKRIVNQYGEEMCCMACQLLYTRMANVMMLLRDKQSVLYNRAHETQTLERVVVLHWTWRRDKEDKARAHQSMSETKRKP